MIDAIPKNAATVDLSHNNLKELDSSLLQKLIALPKLTSLDISHNALTNLPEDITVLTQLRYFICVVISIYVDLGLVFSMYRTIKSIHSHHHLGR